MKLNLGCGNLKMQGYVNVDMHPECNPDMVCDLESVPWPWKTSSVTAVTFTHSLEHMGESPKVFLAMIKELYRICANECRVDITVPHPRHDNFIGDPTHVRPITGQLLSLFSKRMNKEWQRLGGSNTPFALYLDVDFELADITLTIEEPYLSLFNNKKMTREELDLTIREKNNVIKETLFVLKVIK